MGSGSLRVWTLRSAGRCVWTLLVMGSSFVHFLRQVLRILTEPENALLKQYRALMSAENVTLEFSEEAIREIARDAERVNQALENIGARRLHTILERLLEDISFAGPENAGQTIRIEVDDVRAALADLVKDEDLSRYVL